MHQVHYIDASRYADVVVDCGTSRFDGIYYVTTTNK